MFNRLFALVVGLCLPGLAFADAPPQTIEFLGLKLAAPSSPRDSVVYVKVDRGGGIHACGTGTVIASEDGRSLVLTAAHVIQSAQSVELIQLDSAGKPWSYKATILSSDGDGGIYPDLALLETRHDLPAVEIAEEMPARGEPLTMYGFGGATDWLPSFRTGSVLHAGRYTDPWIVSTLPIVPGDSGCASFDSLGQIVGCMSLRGVHALGANVASITTFTVTTVRKHHLFPRFHAKLAARKVVKATAPKAEAPKATAPPKAPAPMPPKAAVPPAAPVAPPVAAAPPASACPNGKCPAPSQARRGLLGFRR